MSSKLIRANTFSICAYDVETGEAGVAVASKCLSVAGHVCYARAGVGAIATQAVVCGGYGSEGLKLLSGGLSSEAVLSQLTAADVTVTGDEKQYIEQYGGEQLTEEGIDYFRDLERGEILWQTRRIRQVGVVDRQGRAAAYTGARTFDWSGSVVGDGYCCQGNMLVGEEVVAAMSEGFESKRGEGGGIVESLYAGLAGGDLAGGDKRGKQAAGVLVMKRDGHWSGSDRWCDVRVDDHEGPVEELGRILGKVGFIR